MQQVQLNGIFWSHTGFHKNIDELKSSHKLEWTQLFRKSLSQLKEEIWDDYQKHDCRPFYIVG